MGCICRDEASFAKKEVPNYITFKKSLQNYCETNGRTVMAVLQNTAMNLLIILRMEMVNPTQLETFLRYIHMYIHTGVCF